MAVILISWGIAFFEYTLQVPAITGSAAAYFNAAQLKSIQEIIILVVFAVFSTFYLKAANHMEARLLALLSSHWVASSSSTSGK